MISKISSKIICAVLTVSLAVTPVFMAPVSAFDGQDVEMQADSWRYSEGEIIFEEDTEEDFQEETAENVEETEAAEEPEAEFQTKSDSAAEGEAMSEEEQDVPEGLSEEEAEDYNAQMGSSEEELTEETTEEEQPEEIEGEAEFSTKSATEKDKYWSIGGDKRYGYLKGIDVSYWQHSINWAKVKAAGVDFAIIRCGYGPNTKSKDDTKFVANVRGCEANGIPYGVYLYSYANTVAGANDEANHALRLLADNGFHPQLPVYYDLEDKTVRKASNATIKKMAAAFCNKLTLEGYRAGVYANLSWWNGPLSGFGTYNKWVAQWNSKCTYGSAYSIWQCSSSAYVSGISGRVDADLLMQPKASMDSFMSGAYTNLASYVTGVTAVNSEGYVAASSATASAATKKGPGRGYYSAASFPDGTKVAGNRSVNGYLEITDTEGDLGTGWISQGSVVSGSAPRDFVTEEVEEGVTKDVLHSYDGSVLTDQWAKVRGKVFYVTSDGTALTGWQTIDGKDYYLGTDGVAVSNTMQTIDGKQYYLGKNGLITKNEFVKVGAYTYGFGEDGVKLAGKKVWLGYRSYILDSQGRAYINKSKTKKKAAYYAKAGSGKKGTMKKGRTFYVLRTSGKWSQMANGYWVKTSLTKKTAVYPQVRPSATVRYKAKLKKKTVSRSGPSNSYIKKKTFKKNRKVTVVGTYGSWSKISSGQWLPTSRLRKQ
ncbi:MAG: GH25 family lysozyme [Bacillota bacterium]